MSSSTSSFNVNTNIDNVDIENNPPVSSVRSTSSRVSFFNNTSAGASESSTKLGNANSGPGSGSNTSPLSPRPINIPSSTKSITSRKGTLASPAHSFTTNNNNISSINSNHTLLSPTSHIEKCKEKIFQQKLEIESLKQRLSITTSASKNELFDLLKEKDIVIENKSNQVKTLTDKFYKIKHGIDGMERELKNLRAAKRESDDECKKITKHLNMREKEVNALVARCQSQEEKLNDMKGARILEKELNALVKMRDKEKEDHTKEIQGLMRDLQQVQNEKKGLMDEIEIMNDKFKNLNRELDASKNEVQEKSNKISSLYDELKDLHESKEKEATECIAMRKNLHDIKNKVFERDTQIDELRTAHRNELSNIKAELAAAKKNEVALDDIITTKEEEISNLNKVLETTNDEFQQVLNDKNEALSKCKALQNEINELRVKHDELSSLTKEEAEAKENERVLLEKQLVKKIDEIEELENINRQLKVDNQENSVQMTELNEKLEFLDKELKSMTEKDIELHKTQNKNMDTISKLEQELRDMEQAKNNLEIKYKEQIQNFEAESDEIQEEFESAVQEYEAKLLEINHELSIHESKTKHYWTELEQLRAKSSKQAELHQVEVKLLEESVNDLKQQVVVKEEEILHLKHQEKNARDRGVRLEEKMIEMEKQFDAIEIDRALVADELNQKLVEAVDKHARLEEEKAAIRNEYRNNMESLESHISRLESDFSKLKNDLESKREQLTERDAIISTLRSEKTVQEQNLESWKVDLDKLICSYDKCKLDHAAQVKKLQIDYAEFKKRTQDEAALFQQDYETLQKLAQETEDKLEAKNTELSKAKDAVEDKKRTIAEMIDCQRSTEQELKEARDVIYELQDISEKFSRENNEMKNCYNAYKVEMENQVNQYMVEIERRDQERLDLDAKMKKMDKEIQDLKAEVKRTEELKATNFLLQDKVVRQEAFLKRKLEKEHKQRMNPHVQNVPPSSPPPPPRTNIPRSRSITRRSNDPISSSRSESVTRQIVSNSDDELEDLLN